MNYFNAPVPHHESRRLALRKLQMFGFESKKRNNPLGERGAFIFFQRGSSLKRNDPPGKPVAFRLQPP